MGCRSPQEKLGDTKSYAERTLHSSKRKPWSPIKPVLSNLTLHYPELNTRPSREEIDRIFRPLSRPPLPGRGGGVRGAPRARLGPPDGGQQPGGDKGRGSRLQRAVEGAGVLVAREFLAQGFCHPNTRNTLTHHPKRHNIQRRTLPNALNAFKQHY